MKKLDMKTPNIIEEKQEILKKYFPNIITEAKNEDGETTYSIDSSLLEQEINMKVVEDGEERYRLDWPGKKRSILKANTPITKTLRPIREDSKDFDNTENLYIEGDNFEVLKILQESYLNKVKMIYIDPPYNTGKDFIYPDDFKKSKEEYEEEIGVEGEEGVKLFRNTDTNGRFHSDWLSMMYERLMVARDLLKDDGVIFISIDDNEIHNLSKLCDEVFGEENLVNRIIWQRNSSGKTVTRQLTVNIEYLLIYAKSQKYKFNTVYKPLADATIKMYSRDDNDGRGKYRLYPMQKTASPGPETSYDYIDNNGKVWKCPEKGWRMVKSKMKALENDGRLCLDNISISEKAYWNERESEGKFADSLWNDLAENSVGNKELSNLLGIPDLFTNPKPVAYITRMLKMQSNKHDLILDFFSGSGTTGHAVMKLNAEDGGNRKYIMVQIPEKTNESSEAHKAGYKTISEIGKERIRRAGDKIVEENKEKLKDKEIKLDIGFRVYKTDSTNMKDVYYHPSELNQLTLVEQVSNIKEDRSPEDLLTQVMLDLGLTLDLPIEKKEIKGKAVYVVDKDALVACFDDNIDVEIVNEIKEIKPLKVVFRDSSFKDDKDRINVETKFKELSPDTEITVI